MSSQKGIRKTYISNNLYKFANNKKTTDYEHYTQHDIC